MDAIFDERTNTLFFIPKVPKGYEGPYCEGVSIDDPPEDLYDWPDGAEAPDVVLCTLISKPSHYRVFKYAKDVDRRAYTPTGKNFGGIVARLPWWPSARDRRRAEIRAHNEGRWIAWTRGFGRVVGTGETVEEALTAAEQAGHDRGHVVSEYVPMQPQHAGAGRS